MCAIAHVFLPTLYAPDHGWLASIRPVVLKRRFGVSAAISGQLRYPVMRASMYPRLKLRTLENAPLL